MPTDTTLDKVNILRRLFNANTITLDELFCILRDEGEGKYLVRMDDRSIFVADDVMKRIKKSHEYGSLSKDFTDGQIQEVATTIIKILNKSSNG